MASWEDFSRIITEAKESKKLDPVDDDVNSDGKVDMNGSKVGCNDPDPRSMKTQVNLVKNKLRAMGLKMSQELEGEQIDEISLPGTGTVMAPKTATGVTSPMMQRKFLGVNIGSPETVKTTKPSKFGPIPEYTPQQVKRYNAQPNRPSTISTNRDGFQQSVAKSSAKPAPTAAKPAPTAAKPQTASAAMSQVFKGTPLSGVANIANRYDRQSNYRDQSPETRRLLGLQNSYEPEGELVDEGKKDLPQTKMYRKAGNLARQALSSKGAKKEKAMDRSAKIVSAITRETERKRFDEIGKSPAHNEEYQLDEEGMSLKDFKANRRKITGAEERADARERGHEGKTWADSGRTYSPDEARSRRAKMSDYSRQVRYQTAEDPDSDNADTYPVSKTKNPKKLRKQKAMGELGEGYIEEKSLSRAQQRFFGMVRAAQDGKMKSPSPEVAKAAKEMTKKQAHDFAATKHKGLPEKKEETKEELSLVHRILEDVMSEAFSGTIPGGKRRKGLSKTIQSRQVDKLADEGDYERADKLQDVSSVKLKKNKPQPTASKSPEPEPEKKQESGSKKPSAGKTTAYERATRTSAAGRIRAARITRQTEREKREYKEKIRQEKKSEQQAEAEDRRKSAEEKQQKLKEIEKGKRADSAERAAQRQYDVKQTKKQNLRKQIGAAINVKGPDVVSSKESDAKAVRADVQSAGQLLGAGAKLVGVAVNKMAEKRRGKQREKVGKEAREKSLKDDSQNESFVNWREEFILEVDDQVANPDQKKIIDISKKKNNIEINPKIDEAAPLIPIIARLAGGMTSRAVGSKLAGSAVQGSLRSNAAEFAANKAGNLATDLVKDKLEKKSRNEPSSSGTDILGMLSRLGTGQNEEFVNEAGAAWTKKSGKNQSGGLNEKGRKSYEAENPGSDLKAPSKEVGNPRRASFCARMSGMKAKLTSKKTANDPDSRINKSLRAWNC